MKKNLVMLSAVVIFAISVTGCKSTDYNDAKSAIYEQNYETAFKLLSDLKDYKDCQELLVDNINTYVNSLMEKDEYDKALSVLNSYGSASDFSNLRNEIQAEKELYDTYSKAVSYFENNKLNDGFELLNTLPSDYRNVQEIYNSYNSLKDTAFKGTHKDGTSGQVSQQIVFTVEYTSMYKKFKLHIYKAVYWSDGTIFTEHNFYLDADDIDGNTIKYSNYVWTINNGQLTEVEKGKTSIYN